MMMNYGLWESQNLSLQEFDDVLWVEIIVIMFGFFLVVVDLLEFFVGDLLGIFFGDLYDGSFQFDWFY